MDKILDGNPLKLEVIGHCGIKKTCHHVKRKY